MRVKGAANWQDNLQLFRGTHQVYGHPKYGLVVTKWPRKRGPAKQPAQAANNKQFAAVVDWCRSPMAADVATAQAATAGTGYLPRDLIESACFGLVIVCTLKDGRILYGARMVSQDAQALLDSITQEVGSLIVRTSAGWVSLEAVAAGKVLTSNGLLQAPTWQAPSGGGGGSPTPLIAQPIGYPYAQDSSAYACEGVTIQPGVNLSISTVWAMLTLTIGQKFRACLVTLSNSSTTPQATHVVLGPEITVSRALQHNWLELSLGGAQALTAGGNYAVCVLRSDGTGTTPAGLWYPPTSGCDPIWQGVTIYYIRAAVNPPIVGTTFDTDGGEQWPYLIAWDYLPTP